MYVCMYKISFLMNNRAVPSPGFCTRQLEEISAAIKEKLTKIVIKFEIKRHTYTLSADEGNITQW